MLKDLLALVFNDWDVHNVGYIEKSTFVHVIHSLGLHFTTHQMNCMFRAIDPDLNGRIFFDEFWVLLVEPITKAIDLLKLHFEFKKQEDVVMETADMLSSLYSPSSGSTLNSVELNAPTSPLSDKIQSPSKISTSLKGNSIMEEEDEEDHDSAGVQQRISGNFHSKMFNHQSSFESNDGNDVGVQVLDTNAPDWSTSPFGEGVDVLAGKGAEDRGGGGNKGAGGGGANSASTPSMPSAKMGSFNEDRLSEPMARSAPNSADQKRRPKRMTLSPSGSGTEVRCTGLYASVDDFFKAMTPNAPSGTSS